MLFEMTAHDDADAVLASVDDDGEPLVCLVRPQAAFPRCFCSG